MKKTNYQKKKNNNAGDEHSNMLLNGAKTAGFCVQWPKLGNCRYPVIL